MKFPAWFLREQKIAQAELVAWRERHPREAPSVREEAAAKVEGRAPKYPPPRGFGGKANPAPTFPSPESGTK
jgi:hypothetical protein